jgi:hypothetical protein
MKFKATLEDVFLSAHVLGMQGRLAQTVAHGPQNGEGRLRKLVWLGERLADLKDTDILIAVNQQVIVVDGEVTFKDTEGRLHTLTAYDTNPITPELIKTVCDVTVEVLQE